ncbi:MAG TPA: hypothetical protein VF211_15220, partial [Burkholderiales bacterium]
LGGDVTTTGTQSFADAVTANGISMTSGGGSISATNAANDFSGTILLSSTGTVSLRDSNALSLASAAGLTFGSLTAGGTLDITTGGATNLGTTSVSGGNLTVTSGNGNITGSTVNVAGTTSLQAGSGSIVLTGSNDFGGTVTAGGNGISLVDVNTLTPADIDAGTGAVSLTAAALAANPGGSVTGASATLSSSANVANLNIDFQGTGVLLTGSATTWQLFGPVTQPSFSVTNPATNVFYNGAALSGSVITVVQQSAGAIGGSINQIATQALQDALDTDSVQKQIDYGFAGDVGTTPPMDHRIDNTGISTPRCLEESREGMPCRN